MKPREPISKEARNYLKQKLDRMKGIEKKKAVKRLEMYDRGFKQRDKDKPQIERG